MLVIACDRKEMRNERLGAKKSCKACWSIPLKKIPRLSIMTLTYIKNSTYVVAVWGYLRFHIYNIQIIEPPTFLKQEASPTYNRAPTGWPSEAILFLLFKDANINIKNEKCAIL